MGFVVLLYGISSELLRPGVCLCCSRLWPTAAMMEQKVVWPNALLLDARRRRWKKAMQSENSSVVQDDNGKEAGKMNSDGEFQACGSNDSFLDSIFEEELDRLLDLDENEDLPYLTEPSEAMEGEESPPNGTEVTETIVEGEYPPDGTEVTETRGGDDSPPIMTRLRVRGISSRPKIEASESSEEDGEDLPPDTEVIESRASKRTKLTSSPKAAPQRKARPPSSPPWTPSPAKSKNRAHAATPLFSGSERKWRTEDEPDQEHKWLPFEPARTPGPQLDTSKNYTVLELFQLFFSNDVVDTLCSNTNKNAKRRQEHGIKEPWKPVSVEEMYKYLSIVIYMGLLNVHTVSDYWNRNRIYCLPFCCTVMTMTRFRAITYSLHMSDPAEDEENDKKKGTADYDRLMRIKPLKDQILDACRAFYHPFQNLSIDERMVHSKARHSLKQYIKSKSYRYGFKLYVLADSRNGYTCDFNVFMTKNPSASGKGESYDVAMNLLKVPYLGTGYHIYVDNFFTSTTFFRDLYKKKLGACGTIREICVGIRENSMPARAEKGTIRWLRDGELLFTKWMGAQPVTMCTTIHKAFAGEQVKIRKQSKNGSWTTQCIPVPEAIKPYNKYMGGVDLSDSLIKCYSVAHKTMKWYKTFFFHFIDIAVVNSFLLQKDMAQMKKKKSMTHKQFREQLCLQLADIGKQEEAEEESSEEEEEEEEQPEEEKELVEVKRPCYPVPIIDPTTVDSSQRKSGGRKKCCLCKESQTNWQCESCQVALCMIPDRNCFRVWHMNKKDLVAEVFKRHIKYNPYPTHPWMEYGGKKIEFKSQKQAQSFIKCHFGLRNNRK
uniref:piggyBac transposable element-derived protein 4-like isoform X1 n=3 Tax=Oncorhynchus gorbuscha TaxID=8017 RepID=UPI001EAF4963|nr:piggyBac transposable element-derived protein 4-like isoform X1 [Oncorhynchus gorbuscha]